MRSLRSHLTYANVMATVAVFIALCGTSYAAIKVTGKEVKDGSLTGKDIKDKSLHAADLAEDAKFAGPVGAQGAMGPQGVAGASGINGINGTNGTNGAPGPTGAKGATGATGQNGTNATVDGVTAGGDLTGAFPNPTLRITNGGIAIGPGTCGGASSASSIASGSPASVYWATVAPLRGGTSTVRDAPCTDSGVINEFQVSKSGVYAIGGGLGFANDSNTTGRREIAILRNGTDYLADQNTPAVAGVQFQAISTVTTLVANDMVTLVAVQDSGDSLGLYPDNRSRFWVQYLGPMF